MKLKNQPYLPGFNFKTPSLSYGGARTPGKRKSARPIDPKQAIHVVLRSSKAIGELSMLRPQHCKHVHAFIQTTARKLGVRIYRYANVGNHIHLLIKVRNRTLWKSFMRQIAGGIAIIVTGAKKGSALQKNEEQRGFWDQLVFTRIVNFGEDFKNLCNYLIKNLFEASGVPMKKLMAQGIRIMGIDEEKVLQIPSNRTNSNFFRRGSRVN